MAAEPHLIRDQAQVRAMCDWSAELDREQALGQFFDSPVGLTDAQSDICIGHEGWVLGAR